MADPSASSSRMTCSASDLVDAAQHHQVIDDFAVESLHDRHEPISHLHAIEPEELVAHLEALRGSRTTGIHFGDHVDLVDPNAHRQRQGGRELDPPAIRTEATAGYQCQCARTAPMPTMHARARAYLAGSAAP
eukprot:scaffold17493_cov51-Phaeocystis_antarctica.AAC.4